MPSREEICKQNAAKMFRACTRISRHGLRSSQINAELVRRIRQARDGTGLLFNENEKTIKAADEFYIRSGNSGE